MNIANILTASRIYLAPVFFIAFFLPQWTGQYHFLSVIIMVSVFIIIEASDLADGAVARKFDKVTDFGKLLDPFADVISRITYFLCFVVADIMPVWALLIILYRELGIIFIRMIMYRDGIAMGARKGGKAKSFTYGIAAALGVFLHATRTLDVLSSVDRVFSIVSFAFFCLSALFALLSFLDYLQVFRLQRK